MYTVGAMKRRPSDDPDAWILGSGTAVLASAVYLVQTTKIPPQNIHILNPHRSLDAALHDRGDHYRGYDQFARCLPVPVGSPLKELLDSIPSGGRQGSSVLHEIEAREGLRDSGKTGGGTCFIIKRDGVTEPASTQTWDLNFRSRVSLLRLMLINERRVGRAQIRDFLPESFFQSAFWAMWSAQFGVQPWHSAVEFRRALRQYLSESRTLNILSCLDISGYYQYEMIFLPLYFYLQSLGVDFQFDTKTEDIVLSGESRRQVSQLHLLRNGVRENQFLGPADIVLVNLGSTVSGSTSGNSNYPPPRSSMEADEELDENWSIWLNLRSKSDHFGEPYSFCTRQFESIMESFTVTVKDPLVFQQLASLAKNSAEAGTFIVILSSQWKLHICVPHQPVFPDQPRDVCVLWGFSNSPLCKGDFIKKPMVQCSGNEILTEALRHLNLDVELFLQHTITIPRLMPRMSAALLSRVQGDRPQVIPEGTTNIGFIGPFVENSHYSTVDISYEVRTAQKAVSELLGTKLGHVDQCRLSSSVFLDILFRK
ncbi:predicted protein [Aspergillus terreus NIH2624]|uniref:Oleate hydratase n=1 Tax=Aspergillus terreus (strain NIH 2624 / FGSC A1156) TaxID=341663 RepID=Q0CR61_ASPTN|nr:uncharacterized protein ATEG_03823 [Aspergillus terreus NIH2624]EAU35625.1 predicted protein [Aspergillus terreus NIH2624]